MQHAVVQICLCDHMLRYSISPCSESFTNVAIPGSTVASFVLRLSEVLSDLAPVLVVIDYSVNDLQMSPVDYEARTEQEAMDAGATVRNALEVATRQLLASGVAVVDMETWMPMPDLHVTPCAPSGNAVPAQAWP